MVYVLLQLLHLPDFSEYLAHHTKGLLIGSQDLVNGGLSVSGLSVLTLPAHSYPPTTPITQAYALGPGCPLPLGPGSSLAGMVIVTS